jgi:hypothetical protein
MQGLLRLVAEGVVVCPPLDAASAEWIADCERRYSDLRPQLARLTLLYLARQQKLDLVFTLDRRDFLVSRNDENKRFRPEPAYVA